MEQLRADIAASTSRGARPGLQYTLALFERAMWLVGKVAPANGADELDDTNGIDGSGGTGGTGGTDGTNDTLSDATTQAPAASDSLQHA
jgi:hypothetical protein